MTRLTPSLVLGRHLLTLRLSPRPRSIALRSSKSSLIMLMRCIMPNCCCSRCCNKQTNNLTHIRGIKSNIWGCGRGWIAKKSPFQSTFSLSARNRMYLKACQVALTTKMSVTVQELKSYCNLGYQQVIVIFYCNRVSLS